MRWARQIAMQRVACNKLRGILFPLLFHRVQSIEQFSLFLFLLTAFAMPPHSCNSELQLQLQLGFGSADLHSKKGHFISNCFLSRIALDGALKIPFRHKRFALRRRSSECDRDGNRQSLSVCRPRKSCLKLSALRLVACVACNEFLI